MFADQQRGSSLHGGKIQRRMRPTDTGGQQRRTDGRRLQHITVAAAESIKTRMEMWRNPLGLPNRHALRQQAVHAAYP